MPELTIRDAVGIASRFVVEQYGLTGKNLLGQDVADVRLEEIEDPDGDAREWVITISFVLPTRTPMGPLMSVGERQYKVFGIDKTSGTIRYMRVRHVGRD